MALVERGLQLRSQEEGRLVTLAEVLVDHFGELVSQARWGKVDVERALREAALDVAAQEERAAQVERGAEECPARDVDDWSLSVAADVMEVGEEIGVVKRARAHWENDRLRFNPEARDLTAAQRIEVLRRDGYTCQCPGCPNHLWLETHHIVFYRDGGQTVPENLLVLCGSYVTSVLCDVRHLGLTSGVTPIMRHLLRGPFAPGQGGQGGLGPADFAVVPAP